MLMHLAAGSNRAGASARASKNACAPQGGWGGAGGEGGGLQCYKVEKRVNYLRGEGVGSKLRWEEMERFGKALK